MVANAKEYNMPGSAVYKDAERVRKLSSTFMSKHNPAYKNPKYVAIPTPIPESLPVEKPTKLRLTAPEKKPILASVVADESRDTSASANPSGRSESAKPTTNKEERTDAGAEATATLHDRDYRGLSFQEAQDRIIDQLIGYYDEESGLQSFFPFVNLPSRSLRDYYAVIKNPTSLKGVKKRIAGWHSREEQTGVTDFKSWDAFESEVSRIWVNAREYNEDSSDMYQLAHDLEKEFKERLAEAKKTVDEPAQPRIKLNIGEPKSASSGLKLKLGSKKPSPAPHSANALKRTSDSPTSQITLSVAAAKTSSVPPTATLARSTASPARSMKTPNGVPTSATQPTQVIGTMPPPPTTARPPSSGGALTGMPPPQSVPQIQPHYDPPTTSYINNSFDSKWRLQPPAKPDSTPGEPDILMKNLHVTTHPDLPVLQPFKIRVPADKIMSQQSVTTTLNAQHAVLRLTADLAEQCKGLNARPYRLFVSNNGARQSQRVVQDYTHLTNGMVNGINGTHSTSEPPKDKGPSWDVRLQPGTNRIEVEVVAAAKQGVGNNDLVMEKISLFIFQMKGT